jgi:hypothetical protein
MIYDQERVRHHSFINLLSRTNFEVKLSDNYYDSNEQQCSRGNCEVDLAAIILRMGNVKDPRFRIEREQTTRPKEGSLGNSLFLISV